MTNNEKYFKCDDSGYIRNWLITGPKATTYAGAMASENQLRQKVVDPEIVNPPRDAGLNKPSPFGDNWRYYDPGNNIFVEQSGFYHLLSILDLYAVTELQVSQDMELPIQLWACGTLDFWVNDKHICRHDVPRYMYPSAIFLTISLKKGSNRLSARLQGLGVRDTRFLLGVRVMESPEKIDVCVPGSLEITQKLVEIEKWLQSVKALGRNSLYSSVPAPIKGSVRLKGKTLDWQAGEDSVKFDPENQTNPVLSVNYENQEIRRSFEIPANRKIEVSKADSLEKHRRDILLHLAKGGKGIRNILAKHILGIWDNEDKDIIFNNLDRIDTRPDCADFDLATMLRLYMGETLTIEEKERIKKTALAFRYWSDEPGSDAMCFGSENHSLLFHGCQLIAGNLFPDEIFSNSGRTGREQAEIGKNRCLKWIQQVEKRGFHEFLSSTYMPLTAGALLNLVDFSGDEDISKRASALVDEIFRQLAMHSFDGVTVAPQGRVYRGVLYPDSSGTQAMMAYATREAVISYNDWISFIGASKNYKIKEAEIFELMKAPVSKLYGQAEVEIQIEKTSAYLLTSLPIPASFQKTAPEPAPPNTGKAIYPGMPGYQQHVWHATLGRDCHIFVNHPGASFDMSSSRPGFWYGNGVFPKTEQKGGMIKQIFDIPESHPIHFTHAHWSSDSFDRQELREHWAFGAKGDGYIGLWCSQSLILKSEILTDRELRAYGLKVTWICVCGDKREFGDFDSFVKMCIEKI